MRNIILAAIVALMGIVAPMKAIATVSNSTNQVIYNGDGVTSTFAFSFNVYNSASENDLLVSEQNTTTGAVTNLTLNTDYSVSLTHAVPSPGTITLSAGALSSGIKLSIVRQLPLTQLVSEADNSATPASVRNNVYDRQVMVTQQLQQQLTRAILQNIFSTTSISLPAGVAGYGLCWDSTATTITNCASLSGTIGVPIANSNLQTLTQASLVNGSSLFGSGTMTALTATTLTGTTILATGNVGIGSATPGKSLDVQGTIRALNFTGPGGNVGIGSTVPGQALDVQGTTRSTSFMVTGNPGIIGAATTKSITTVYLATTDLNISGNIQCSGGGSCTINILTDSGSSPSYVLCAQSGVTSGMATCSGTVRKNDYYEFTDSGNVSSVNMLTIKSVGM